MGGSEGLEMIYSASAFSAPRDSFLCHQIFAMLEFMYFRFAFVSFEFVIGHC